MKPVTQRIELIWLLYLDVGFLVSKFGAFLVEKANTLKVHKAQVLLHF